MYLNRGEILDLLDDEIARWSDRMAQLHGAQWTSAYTATLALEAFRKLILDEERKRFGDAVDLTQPPSEDMVGS